MRRRSRGDDEYVDEVDADEASADSPLSIASCVRQANRAGRRWGLVARRRGDAVKLSEVVHSLDGGAICEVVETARHDVATIDDEHPFTAALYNRVGNGEIDLAERARRFDQMKRAEEKAKARELAEEMRERWMGRRRSVFIGPDLYVPAGLANRRRG